MGDGAFLTDGDVVEVLVLGVVVHGALGGRSAWRSAAWCPNQVAAIVVILAFTQFVEPIARLALGAFDADRRGRRSSCPARPPTRLIGASLFGEMGGGGDLLSRRRGRCVVMLGYVGGFAAARAATPLCAATSAEPVASG